jgi:hypothetical protein
MPILEVPDLLRVQIWAVTELLRSGAAGCSLDQLHSCSVEPIVSSRAGRAFNGEEHRTAVVVTDETCAATRTPMNDDPSFARPVLADLGSRAGRACGLAVG